MDQVRRNREGERPSGYEQRCQGEVSAMYGQLENALQVWNNLLNRTDVYPPPIRRQIVWTELRRRDGWSQMKVRTVDRVIDLLNENLQTETDNDKDLRLWIQAVRWSSRAIGIASVTERVAYWRLRSGSLESTYYLYVLHALQTIEGSVVARDDALRYLEEARQKARFRRNRTRSFEWWGKDGKGINRLIHQSTLGEWNTENAFWSNTTALGRLMGRISRINGPQAGQIELDCGLEAFFVPARCDFVKKINLRVEFYVGFSYDGPRAWEVRLLGVSDHCVGPSFG